MSRPMAVRPVLIIPRGAQLLPNDDREQERLDYMHHVFRLTLDGELYYSKLDNPQRILDIGTGTGTLGFSVVASG